MQHHAEALKARMMRRLVGPELSTVAELARETGIPMSTLHRWKAGAARLGFVPTKPDAPKASDETPTSGRRPQDWSALERAQLVLEANGLGEPALGELLRRRGVHREQLSEWRAALEHALAQPGTKRTTDSKRIRQLEREVAYKDKALAETAALLVLQKKLHLMFQGPDADDDTDDKSGK